MIAPSQSQELYVPGEVHGFHVCMNSILYEHIDKLAAPVPAIFQQLVEFQYHADKFPDVVVHVDYKVLRLIRR